MTRPARGRPNPIRATSIEDRRAKILELAVLGYTTRQIAAKLGCTSIMVQRDARIVRQRRVLDQIVLDDQLAQRSIARYEKIIQLAYEGFLRSAEDDISVEEELVKAKNGRELMKLVGRKTRGQAGQAAFLNVIINAQAKIDEINGLIGKDKFEAGIEQQTPIFMRVVVESREQVAEYGSITLAQAKASGIIEGQATVSDRAVSAGQSGRDSHAD
jgi:hypothetical protein